MYLSKKAYIKSPLRGSIFMVYEEMNFRSFIVMDSKDMHPKLPQAKYLLQWDIGKWEVETYSNHIISSCTLLSKFYLLQKYLCSSPVVQQKPLASQTRPNEGFLINIPRIWTTCQRVAS
jgi:hypothetical protein